MKTKLNLALLLIGLLMNLAAQAQGQTSTHQIQCRSKSVNVTHLTVHLTEIETMPKSSLYQITTGTWNFNFATARLICNDNYLHLSIQKSDLKCIGYVFRDGIVQISISMSEMNGQLGTATVQNLTDNVYKEDTEGLQYDCALVKSANLN